MRKHDYRVLSSYPDERVPALPKSFSTRPAADFERAFREAFSEDADEGETLFEAPDSAIPLEGYRRGGRPAPAKAAEAQSDAAAETPAP